VKKIMDALALLAQLRESGEMQPKLVVEHGQVLIASGKIHALGDEAWIVYEQILTAALDMAHIQLAQACLEILTVQFPNSKRVRRHEAAILEAQGKWDEADMMYQEMLAENESDAMVQKRRIAILIAKNAWVEATAALVTYLDVFYVDGEAWLQLTNVYLQQNLYQQAAYCIEELILQEPFNPFYHVLHGEVCYTMDHVKVALKAFCRAIEISDDHVRGLYGVKQCCKRLLAEGDKDKNLLKLDEMVTTRLVHVYSAKTNKAQVQELRKVVDEWLAR
jgi:tetratricopeptide (TPR) repeat protein